MKVFLTNLRKYNEGVLRGQWIDPAGMDDEDWREALDEIGVDPDHEYFISDYDDDPANLNLGENEPLDYLTEVAEYCDEYGVDIVNAVADLTSGWQEVMDVLDDGDYTVYDASDDEELGEVLCEEGLLEVPEYLVNYINYEAVGRDFSIDANGEYFEVDGQTVFVEVCR